MWSSCPDPTPSLIASAFAGGAVALACDYLRRVAVLRAAQERAAQAVGSLVPVAVQLCALWHASEWYDNHRIPRPPIVAPRPPGQLLRRAERAEIYILIKNWTRFTNKNGYVDRDGCSDFFLWGRPSPSSRWYCGGKNNRPRTPQP
jgi:hypothetical protein